MGRIEILTRPGSDRSRGQVSFNFNDESFNARNPFSKSTTRAPLQTRQYGGNFGGPILKSKASFFIDFDKRDVCAFARKAGVPLDLTFSCERTSDTPCGECLSCRDREACLEGP